MGTSTDEGVDPCLTGSVLEPVIGERSGRLPVLDNAVDVRDCWQGVMGYREETGVRSTVDGGERGAFIRCGAAREATGGRSRGGRIADDWEAGDDGRRRRDGRGAGIFAGLSRRRSAGMMGLGGELMEQLRVAST